MHCPDCERIRQVIHPANRLLAHFPTGHSAAKAQEAAGQLGLAAEALDEPHTLGLSATGAEVERLATALHGALSGEEQAATRLLLLPEGTEPGLGDYLGTRSLREVIATVQGMWLAELLRQDRLFSMLQPILRADGSPYGHEALVRARGEGGKVIGAGALLGAAQDNGLLFTLDLAARRSAMEAARRRGAGRGVLFVNFNPSSIYDPSMCLRTTHAHAMEIGLEPGQVVFEVTESAHVADRGHLRNILSYYRAAGFRVALDDIGAGFSGLNMLQELRPDYVKIDMELIRGVDADPFRQSILRHLIGIAKDTGTITVAEGIETEAELAWIREAGADLVQGYLLGRPAEV